MSHSDENLKPSAAVETTQGKPVKLIHRESGNLPTFQADGGWGSVNNYSLIRIGFYAEHPQIPTAVIQHLNADGSPKGDQIEVGMDDAHFVLVRDFQCNVILTLPSAIQINQMLGSFIVALQQQMKDQKAMMEQQLKNAAEKKAQQAK